MTWLPLGKASLALGIPRATLAKMGQQGRWDVMPDPAHSRYLLYRVPDDDDEAVRGDARAPADDRSRGASGEPARGGVDGAAPDGGPEVDAGSSAGRGDGDSAAESWEDLTDPEVWEPPTPTRPHEHVSASVFSVWDVHLGHHDRRALRTAIQCLEAAQPTHFVAGGDVLECEALSTHTRYEPASSLKAELDLWFAFSDAVTKAAPNARKVMLGGNHDHARFKRWLMYEGSAMRGILDLVELLELRERGWEFVPYRKRWQPYPGAPVRYTHGSWGGMYPAGTAAKKHPFTVRHGHNHRSQKVVVGCTETYTWRAGLSSPCLRSLNYEDVEYMKTPPDWVHGFGFDEMRGRLATTQNVEFSDRRAYWRGRVFG